jgi:hypothetical protein
LSAAWLGSEFAVVHKQLRNKITFALKNGEHTSFKKLHSALVRTEKMAISKATSIVNAQKKVRASVHAVGTALARMQKETRLQMNKTLETITWTEYPPGLTPKIAKDAVFQISQAAKAIQQIRNRAMQHSMKAAQKAITVRTQMSQLTNSIRKLTSQLEKQLKLAHNLRHTSRGAYDVDRY